MKNVNYLLFVLTIFVMTSVSMAEFFDGNNVYLEVLEDHSYKELTWPGSDGFDVSSYSDIWLGALRGGEPYVVSNGEWKNIFGPVFSDEDEWNDVPEGVEKLSELDYFLSCNDDNADNGPWGIKLWGHGLSWSDNDNADYLIFNFPIFNETSQIMEDTYFGIEWDFDIGGSADYSDDMVAYDEEHDIAYMYDYNDNPPIYAGISYLSDDACSFSWSYSYSDDSEQYNVMSSGEFDSDSTNPYDYNFVICTGPYDIPNGERRDVDWVLVIGNTFDEMIENLITAESKYAELGLDIELTYFRANPNYGSISLKWEIISDENIIGFNLYRREVSVGEAPVRENYNSPLQKQRDYLWFRVNDTHITGTNPY